MPGPSRCTVWRTPAIRSGVTSRHPSTPTRRPALDKLLGRGTTVVAASPISAIERLTRYHLSWRSVWFHNSLRGALGLALAVLVAQLLDVQHGFWVGLGTLSVLRTTASNTGSTAVRAVVGTAVGVIVSAPILILLGDGPGLWVALPIGMFLAGFATAALPLAVGQGAFSAAVLVLFALLAPGARPIGLIRVEDVAIGAVAGVVVGLLLWPRGAAAEIRRAMAEAYRAGARLLDQRRGSGGRAAGDLNRDRSRWIWRGSAALRFGWTMHCASTWPIAAASPTRSTICCWCASARNGSE